MIYFDVQRAITLEALCLSFVKFHLNLEKRAMRRMYAPEWSKHYKALFKTLKDSQLCSRWSCLVENQNRIFKFLWLSLLPAKMRNIQSKMKVLEWSRQIFHCMSMRIQMLNGS